MKEIQKQNHDEKEQERTDNSQRGGLLTNFVKLISRITLLGSLLLFLLGVGLLLIDFYLLRQQPGDLPTYLIREIGTALLLGGVGTGLIYFFIVKYYDWFKDRLYQYLEEDVTQTLSLLQEQIEKRTRDIADDINEQTHYLVNTSASLEAMRESGIARIYASRSSASSDIAQDLTTPNNSRIRLIGISLNDFVRGDQPVLNKAWKVIEEYIRGERSVTNPNHELDIKALIIDPESLGAQLRSQAESREPPAIAGRLYTDVMNTAKHMADLVNAAQEKQSKTGVSFNFRLYKLPPILFLSHTDTVSYIQQYHFWSSRYAEVPIPVIKSRGLPESSHTHGLHYEMENHFDWIWERASVSSRDFLDGNVLGVDKGLYQSGTVNVFNDTQEARRRILWLLNHAKDRLYIQGISLHSFFDFGNLFAAIMQLVERGNVDIKVLLLDPKSEQAYFRSYREHLFVNPEMTFGEYRSDPTLHQNSRLFRDTQATLNNISTAISPSMNKLFQIKLYASAPTCFMLMVDDNVLVEQYHYGKILPEGYRGDFPVILGKDMPLVEYTRTPRDLFDINSLRNPFKLLENHFEFNFNKCAHPPLSSSRKARGSNTT